MNTLRIYFSGNWNDASSPCPWALCDENDTVLQSGNDPIASLPKGKECIGIVAPDRVLSVSVKPPSGSRRRWQAALPFVTEEHTLPDPEDNHVVPGPVLPDGRVALSVVDKPWLRRIVEACRTANLSLRRMVPETFLPALSPGGWVLVWDGCAGFLRTGSANGMALDCGDATTPPLTLQLSLPADSSNASLHLPEKIEVRNPAHLAQAQPLMPEWDGLPAALVAGPAWDWRRAHIPADTPNLLWGEFAPRARLSEWWPRLRPAGFILLAALGVEAAGANVEWAMLALEKKSLAQDMEHSFRTAFGTSGVLVNPPLQMKRNLAELRHSAGLPDSGDFLPLLDAAAPALATMPAGSMRGLHYESGRLDVDIALPDGNAFHGLQQRLQGKGIVAQLGDINDVGNGAEGRLTLLSGKAP